MKMLDEKQLDESVKKDFVAELISLGFCAQKEVEALS